MSSLKDLFISIKVKPTGTEKLKEFNETIKTTLSLMKDFKRVDGINTSENKLVQTEKEVTEKTTKNKRGFLNIAPNIASVVYLTKALTNLIGRVGQLSYELLKLNRNFGVSTNMLQNFGFQAVANGVKMEDFNSAIATLKKNSADIMLGRGNISPYALLGLNPHEDPEKMLISLQKRLRELPESIGTAFASDLGLSMDMINYIRKADFSKAGSRTILSNKELSILERSRDLILDLKNNFMVLVQKIGVSLAPIVTTVFGKLNNLILSISSNASRLGDILTVVFGILLTKLALANPIIASLVALGLVIEDLVKNGGQGILMWIEIIFKRLYLVADTLVDLISKPFEKLIGLFGLTEKIVDKVIEFQNSKWGSKIMGAISGSNLNYSTDPRIMEAIIDAQKNKEDRERQTTLNLSGSVRIENEKGEKVGEITEDNVSVTDTSLAGEGAG